MTIHGTPALPDLRGVTSWRKSSRSSSGGNGQCVEVACLNEHAWRKSSRSSGGGNGNCVEVAPVSPATVAIRDSKISNGHDYPVLSVDTATWAGFIGSLKSAV